MPVFNGERFVGAALESLIAQTFQDFEIIVCDNASTDRTATICREIADRDARIRYERNPSNIGAAPNFRRVFSLSRGRYFKWAAADDICAPEYLERCVAELERDPGTVVCHTHTIEIDDAGNPVRSYDFRLRTASDAPPERFRDLIAFKHPCVAIFGVMRSEVLARTPLIASYVASDFVLLAELSLYGKLRELPDPLFYRRLHSTNSIWLDKRIELLTWFDTRLDGRISLPHWRVTKELVAAVRRAPISAHDRYMCLRYVPSYVVSRRDDFWRDVTQAVRRLLARVGPLRSLVLTVRGRLKGHRADVS